LSVELAPGYEISRLTLGGWQFAAGHRLDGAHLDAALDVLVEAADRGVTTFDCADIYTGVEELYGRFLARWKTTSGSATRIRVHTKFVPDYGHLPDVDEAYVRRIIERSLARLGVETLDLVQYYWWRDEVPGMEQTALWLADMQREGKIRHIGVTNLDVARIRRIEEAGVRLVSNQVQYSALDRRPEGALARNSDASGMGILCFGALAGGLLTDRWLGAAWPEGTPANRSLIKYRLIVDEFGGWIAFQTLLEEMRSIADEHGVDIATVALRFVLDQPHVASVIFGATRTDQVSRNLRALSCELTPDDHARLRAHLDAAPGPGGEIFELERDRTGPHGRIMRYNLNDDDQREG
jgi:aryl-alcohol dehydrogenase-like predicted oxidoreductase